MNKTLEKIRPVLDDETERVRNQTVDEWLQEYETEKKVFPAQRQIAKPENVTELRSPSTNSMPAKATLAYMGHRTTKLGRLVLAFIDTKTGEEVAAFFNVSIKQGKNGSKGTSYRTGEGGQFNPPPRGKFHRWWMQTVERAPRRWSRVHKELKPRLEYLEFTADLETAYSGDRKPYVLAKNLQKTGHKLGTTWAQKGHKIGTNSVHNDMEQAVSCSGF
jgi:hypothetical protein